MGLPVLILGESGSGKTFSIKEMDPEKVGVFMCEKNRLPFKKKFKTYKVRNMKQVNDKGAERILRQGQVIEHLLKTGSLKTYVIDDSQYIMANEFFDRALEKGYDKYTDIGKNFRDLIHCVNNDIPDDVIVYFLHHPEFDGTTNKTKAKTIGKLLDDKLTVEGCFDIVLRCQTDGKNHWFSTQSDGFDTVKSPEGMFEGDENRIPNDLAAVDARIREYYGMEAL